MENCLGNMTTLPLDGLSLQDWWISLGFSDLGNITRDAFSHGWIVSEQFLQCIRHKHAICQHQACLISPPAFSPSSYIWYLLHGKSKFFFFLEANSHCRMREQSLFGGIGASWVKLTLLSQENFFPSPWSILIRTIIPMKGHQITSFGSEGTQSTPLPLPSCGWYFS